MTKTDSLSLSKLIRSLGLLHADQALAKQNFKVVLYCDTYDAVEALQGIVGYFDVGSGRLRADPRSHQVLFEQPRALTACLLASGWLGSFRLLPPHGAELARFLDDGRLFPLEGKRDLVIDKFLKATGFTEKNEGRSIIQLSPDEIYSIVKDYADHADRAFKAVQCILYTPQERLVRWYRESTLQSTALDFDYLRLTRSRRFVDLVDAFSRHRGKRANDYADSVALVMLRDLCRRAEGGTLREIPRFFDSTGFLARMAKEAGIEEELWVRLPGGLKTPILVDSDYLLHRASFLPFRVGRSSSASPAVDPTDLLHRLQQITDGDEGQVKSEDAETLLLAEKIGGVPLAHVLTDLSNFAFLKNIWLSELAREEIKEFADRFGKSLVETEEFRVELNEAIGRLRRDLGEKAESFIEVYEAWHILRDGILNLRRRQKERARNSEVEFDPIRDLELVRFGLPAAVSSTVSEIMTKLLDDTLEENQLVGLRRWSELVQRYYEARRSPENAIEAAQVAAAVLWALKRDRLIVELLERVAGRTEETPIDVFYAAACFRGASGRGVEILDRLNSRLTNWIEKNSVLDSDREQAANLGIGVGYLSKHLWDREGYKISWMRPNNEEEVHSNPQFVEEGTRLLRWSIKSVRFAIETLYPLERRGQVDRSIKMKMLYARNQKLFYYTLLGPVEAKEVAEMTSAYYALKDEKPRSREYWQATFDDTLARYHHFRSRQAANIQGRLRQLRQALEYSMKASKGDPYDDLITGYYGTLVDEVTEVEAMLSEERNAKRNA